MPSSQVDVDGGSYRPFAVDDWTLLSGFWGEDQDIDLTLVDLIAQDEKDADISRDSPPTTIRTRCVQHTLTEMVFSIAITERVSVAKVQRVATRQGLLLIRNERLYTTLEGAFRTHLETTRTRYNSDRNNRLGERGKLAPTDHVAGIENVRVYSWVHGAIEELAHKLGMQIQHLGLFCLLYSLSTVPNLGAYTSVILTDIERFRGYLGVRAESLLR